MARDFVDPDYIDVAERVSKFADKFPEGSLQSKFCVQEIGDTTFVVCDALAYRTPDDPRPGQGLAWVPVPGLTPFTRNSELMNAQTSAWGRAIVALGFKTKKIASRQEMQMGSGAAEGSGDRPDKAGVADREPAAPATNGKLASEAQRRRLFAIKNQHDVDDSTLRWILHDITGQESTAQIPADKYDKVIEALETRVPFS